MRGLKNASLCCVCQIHNLTHGAGRNIGACVVGGKPARPCRSSCWHTLPILRCSAFMSATAGSLHPDIVRARNIPAMNTNTFPLTNHTFFSSVSPMPNAVILPVSSRQRGSVVQPLRTCQRLGHYSIHPSRLWLRTLCVHGVYLYPPQLEYLYYHCIRLIRKVKEKVT